LFNQTREVLNLSYFSVLSLSSISPLTTTGLKEHPRYQAQAFPAQQLVIPPSKPPGL